jgi:hypothetical protein
VNTSNVEPGTLNTSYFLNKVETKMFIGQQYSAHVTMFHHFVGQHDVESMERALVDCGANVGICGGNMHVLEGSERFLMALALPGIMFANYALLLHRHWYQLTSEWHCLVKVKVFCHVSKWKNLVLTSMINLDCYLVESKVY